jgi:plastocyanin
MRHRLRQVKGRPMTYAAAGVVAACGILAAVGAAGAAEQAGEVRIGVTASLWTPNDPTNVPVATGDEVVWDFTTNSAPHNLRAVSGPASDPEWMNVATPIPTAGEYRRTFGEPGEYKFRCEIHEQMRGTLVVTGPPVGTPTPPPSVTPSATPTPTATPTSTPTPTPTPDDHTSTPPPTVNVSDTAAPGLSGVKAKGIRRGARVTFKLSEPATVTIRVKKKSGKVVRTSSLQVRPGTRTVTVRSSRLKRGRYTVELQARDSSGNRSALLRSALRIRGK